MHQQGSNSRDERIAGGGRASWRVQGSWAAGEPSCWPADPGFRAVCASCRMLTAHAARGCSQRGRRFVAAGAPAPRVRCGHAVVKHLRRARSWRRSWRSTWPSSAPWRPCSASRGSTCAGDVMWGTGEAARSEEDQAAVDSPWQPRSRESTGLQHESRLAKRQRRGQTRWQLLLAAADGWRVSRGVARDVACLLREQTQLNLRRSSNTPPYQLMYFQKAQINTGELQTAEETGRAQRGIFRGAGTSGEPHRHLNKPS